MTVRDIWTENKPSEIGLWEALISGQGRQDWCADVRRRLVDSWELGEPLASFAARVPSQLVEVADVGSGPAKQIDRRHPTKTVRILMIDPLADEYNDILRRNGYASCANIFKAEGEVLSEVLPRNHFHIAYARNALDHSWDPARCIREMVAIIRVGGYLFVEGATDEGERQKYEGLHQWNFRASGTDDCLIWRPDQEIKLKDFLGSSVKIAAYSDKEWIQLTITKLSD